MQTLLFSFTVIFKISYVNCQSGVSSEVYFNSENLLYTREFKRRNRHHKPLVPLSRSTLLPNFVTIKNGTPAFNFTITRIIKSSSKKLYCSLSALTRLVSILERKSTSFKVYRTMEVVFNTVHFVSFLRHHSFFSPFNFSFVCVAVDTNSCDKIISYTGAYLIKNHGCEIF